MRYSIIFLLCSLATSSSFTLPPTSLSFPPPPPSKLSLSSTPPPTSSSSTFPSSPTTIPRGGGSPLSKLASTYNALTVSKPLLTKTLTSLLLMSLSFLVSNIISPPSPSPTLNLQRGLKHSPLFLLLLLPGLYFPITSHYYYTAINKIIPGTKLTSTLKKSAIGQLTYGPLYTSVFFFSMLIPVVPSRTFFSSLLPSLRLLPSKIASDFLPVWRSGVFYWVSVDLISFSFIPTRFITAFVQVASFFWTVYLAIAARS